MQIELEQFAHPGSAASGDGEQQALRVLMMAQRTADEHVNDARREADKLLTEARRRPRRSPARPGPRPRRSSGTRASATRR